MANIFFLDPEAKDLVPALTNFISSNPIRLEQPFPLRAISCNKSQIKVWSAASCCLITNANLTEHLLSPEIYYRGIFATCNLLQENLSMRMMVIWQPSRLTSSKLNCIIYGIRLVAVKVFACNTAIFRKGEANTIGVYHLRLHGSILHSCSSFKVTTVQRLNRLGPEGERSRLQTKTELKMFPEISNQQTPTAWDVHQFTVDNFVSLICFPVNQRYAKWWHERSGSSANDQTSS